MQADHEAEETRDSKDLHKRRKFGDDPGYGALVAPRGIEEDEEDEAEHLEDGDPTVEGEGGGAPIPDDPHGEVLYNLGVRKC